MILNAIFALGKVLLLGKFKLLVISSVLKESAVKMFTSFRKSKGKKSCSISPKEISGSFHNFRVADMSQTLVPLGKCYLLHFLRRIFVCIYQWLKVIRTRHADNRPNS